MCKDAIRSRRFDKFWSALVTYTTYQVTICEFLLISGHYRISRKREGVRGNDSLGNERPGTCIELKIHVLLGEGRFHQRIHVDSSDFRSPGLCAFIPPELVCKMRRLFVPLRV